MPCWVINVITFSYEDRRQYNSNDQDSYQEQYDEQSLYTDVQDSGHRQLTTSQDGGNRNRKYSQDGERKYERKEKLSQKKFRNNRGDFINL